MREKTFILGLGAQKSGTSWLHAYIRRFDQVNMGFAKEYHVWDAINIPECGDFKISSGRRSQLNSTDYFRFCMQNINGFYEQYFRSILNSGFNITGDITPSYSGLNHSDLKSIKTKLETLGMRVKVVFLMRDPVSRCLSAARFKKKNFKILLSDENVLRKNYKTDQFQMRTRYEITCENIKKSFGNDSIYFGFYENLFEENSIKKISEYLGVQPDFEFSNIKINTTIPDGTVSEEILSEVRNFYKQTYEYCNRQFPVTEQLWQSP